MAFAVPNLPEITFAQRLQTVAYPVEKGVQQPGIVSLIKHVKTFFFAESGPRDSELRDQLEVMDLLTRCQAMKGKETLDEKLLGIKYNVGTRNGFAFTISFADSRLSRY